MAKKRRKAPEIKKPKTTLRERNVKAAKDKVKPKRVRKAAVTAVKPIGKAAKALKTEYHIIPRDKKEQGFFTRSRRMTPRYFVDSIAELKHVSWPGRKETWKLVFAVFVFAVVIGLMISLLDYGLDKAFRKVIL